MKQMSNKLKPCPFCNGEANIGKVKYSDNCEEVKLNNRSVGYFGRCVQCSATMQQGLSYETEEIAINKWNRRFVTQDKNSNDVFEGDLFTYDCCGNFHKKGTGYFVWDEDILGWRLQNAKRKKVRYYFGMDFRDEDIKLIEDE